MLLWILRGLFGIIIIGMATGALVSLQQSGSIGIVAFLLIFTTGIIAVAIDVFIRNKEITTISAVYFGLLLGFLLGTLFSMALEPIVRDSLPANYNKDILVQQVRFFIILVCSYISVTTLLQTKDEFRFIIPYVEFSKQIKGARPLVPHKSSWFIR